MNKINIRRKIWKTLSNELVLAGIFCVGLLLSSQLFHFVQVSGSSMSPTYKTMQIVTTSKDKSKIDIGDVVVFRLKNNKVGKDFQKKDGKSELIIKRVVGKEGDTIQVKNGELYRNGKKVDEAFPKIENAGIAKTPVKLAKNQFFVLGDNRNNSDDSRRFGPISKNDITGVVKNKLF